MDEATIEGTDPIHPSLRKSTWRKNSVKNLKESEAIPKICSQLFIKD